MCKDLSIREVWRTGLFFASILFYQVFQVILCSLVIVHDSILQVLVGHGIVYQFKGKERRKKKATDHDQISYGNMCQKLFLYNIDLY